MTESVERYLAEFDRVMNSWQQRGRDFQRNRKNDCIRLLVYQTMMGGEYLGQLAQLIEHEWEEPGPRSTCAYLLGLSAKQLLDLTRFAEHLRPEDTTGALVLRRAEIASSMQIFQNSPTDRLLQTAVTNYTVRRYFPGVLKHIADNWEIQPGQRYAASLQEQTPEFAAGFLHDAIARWEKDVAPTDQLFQSGGTILPIEVAAKGLIGFFEA